MEGRFFVTLYRRYKCVVDGKKVVIFRRYGVEADAFDVEGAEEEALQTVDDVGRLLSEKAESNDVTEKEFDKASEMIDNGDATVEFSHVESIEFCGKSYYEWED